MRSNLVRASLVRRTPLPRWRQRPGNPCESGAPMSALPRRPCALSAGSRLLVLSRHIGSRVIVIMCKSRCCVVVVQSLHHVRLLETPWTAAQQVSPSFTSSWSLLKLMSTELVMLSNHLVLCCSLLLLPSIFPSIRVFPSDVCLELF